jgi:hypothetical protein
MMTMMVINGPHLGRARQLPPRGVALFVEDDVNPRSATVVPIRPASTIAVSATVKTIQVHVAGA